MGARYHFQRSGIQNPSSMVMVTSHDRLGGLDNLLGLNFLDGGISYNREFTEDLRKCVQWCKNSFRRNDVVVLTWEARKICHNSCSLYATLCRDYITKPGICGYFARFDRIGLRPTEMPAVICRMILKEMKNIGVWDNSSVMKSIGILSALTDMELFQYFDMTYHDFLRGKDRQRRENLEMETLTRRDCALQLLRSKIYVYSLKENLLTSTNSQDFTMTLTGGLKMHPTSDGART